MTAPATTWESEIVESLKVAKDLNCRIRKLADTIPADGQPNEMLTGALAILDALGVRPSLVDPVGEARNTGAGTAGWET